MKASYAAYLASPDWKKKRAQKLNRSGGKKRRCSICGATENLDIHHLIYRKRLEEAKQDDLRILCRHCHDTAHELIRSGAIRFRSESIAHRFGVTQAAVRKHLGLSARPTFEPATEKPRIEEPSETVDKFHMVSESDYPDLMAMLEWWRSNIKITP